LVIGVTMARATNQRASDIPNRKSIKLADVEYRLLFNEVNEAWDVYRNGVPTAVTARKKRTSAIDSAIRDAKAELEISEAVVMVTCLQGHKLETLWKGTCLTSR
jgi:hypothetical protein